MKNREIGAVRPILLASLLMTSLQAVAQLDEITVTAQRRDENLQTVPIAVTVFSGDFIADNKIIHFADLALKIPGFSYSSFNKSRLNPALRGGSSSLSGPGGEQAVTFYIDDVYYGTAGDFQLDFFDVERVEVLRGPQGTLFGRNSTGGVINVITKKPTDEVDGAFEFSLGNYSFWHARGFLSGPVTDSVNASMSISAKHRDGTSENVATGQSKDSIGRFNFRGKLLWTPSDSSELLLYADYGIIDEDDNARDYLGPTPTAQLLQDDGFVPNTDPRAISNFDDGLYTSETIGLALNAKFDLAAGQLISITSFRSLEAEHDPTDLLGVSLPFVGVSDPRDLEQFTQEIRFVSDLSDRFSYIAGMFFLDATEERDWRNVSIFDSSTFVGALSVGADGRCVEQGDELNFAVPECRGVLPGLNRPLVDVENHNQLFQKSDTESIAAFVHGSYSLTDVVNLTLGLRYTEDTKSAEGFVAGDYDFIWNPNFEPAGFMGEEAGYVLSRTEETWDAWTPRATIDFQVSDDVLLFATAARGYRAGAFQLEGDPTTAGIPVAPEFVWTYEVGGKSILFDNRLRLNATAFLADYTDLQFTFTSAQGVLIVSNAGKAEVSGLELEAEFAPTDWLNISVGYSYQDGETTDIPAETGIPEGIAPGQTPEHSLNAGFATTSQLGNGWTIETRADYLYKSEYQTELNADPAFTTGVDGLINAGLNLIAPDGRWALGVWGKNLTDEDIVIYGQDFRFMTYTFDEAFNDTSPDFDPAAAVSNMPRYAAPRTYGMSVTYRFN